MWQAYQMDSCVPSPQNSGFSQHNAFCSVTVNFAQPFEENVYYLTAIGRDFAAGSNQGLRSEEHTSELQSLMRISYSVFCLKKKNIYKLPTKHVITNYIYKINT